MCVPAENSDAGTLLFTGLAFHGVPSGHEFNSFVLGLYNAAGPGQPLDDDLKARAEAIDTPIDVMILVSLTCTMCPETVLAAQRIASLNPNVRAEAYDVAHFPELKDQYGAMSVPCIVINHPRRRAEGRIRQEECPADVDIARRIVGAVPGAVLSSPFNNSYMLEFSVNMLELLKAVKGRADAADQGKPDGGVQKADATPANR